MDQLNKIKNLTADEQKMFSEIEHVMNKFRGITREFGLCLVHEHFDLIEGEVLYETNNKNSRTLLAMPLDVSKLPGTCFASAWKFVNHNPNAYLYCCDDGGGPGGYGHNETGGNR